MVNEVFPLCWIVVLWKCINSKKPASHPIRLGGDNVCGCVLIHSLILDLNFILHAFNYAHCVYIVSIGHLIEDYFFFARISWTLIDAQLWISFYWSIMLNSLFLRTCLFGCFLLCVCVQKMFYSNCQVCMRLHVVLIVPC